MLFGGHRGEQLFDRRLVLGPEITAIDRVIGTFGLRGRHVIVFSDAKPTHHDMFAALSRRDVRQFLFCNTLAPFRQEWLWWGVPRP